MKPFFEFNNVTGGYGDMEIVRDISGSVAEGEILGIFGRNGVGKTTLGKLLHGGLATSYGMISMSGVELTKLKVSDRRNSGIGYMPQTNMVFDNLSVRENLQLGENKMSPDTYFNRFPNFATRLDQTAGTMSGGERKILAFIRTMIEDTSLLILDEPSEGVQAENIEYMAASLQERASQGSGVILIEQNINFLMSVSDTFLGLDSGKVVFEKSAHETSIEDIRKVLSV